MRLPLLLLPLVLVGTLGTGCSGGDDGAGRRSADYTASVEQWRTTVLAPAVAAARQATFSDLVVPDRRENAKELAAQAVRCRTITTAASTVSVLRAPALEGEGTEQARALSEQLATSTTGWVDAVGPPLAQVGTFCRSYAASLRVSAQVDAAERALAGTLSRKGTVTTTTRTTGTTITTTTSTCEVAAGCIPSDAAKLARYLKAYALARITLRDQQYRVLGGLSTPCRLTDYQPVCAVYAARRATTIRFNTAFRDALRKGDTKAVARAAELADAEAARFTRQLGQAYLVAFPSLDRSVAGADTRNQVRLLRGYEEAVRSAAPPG